MAYIAPHNPVADWRCVPQGHGYGNYFDPVSGTWASVTRTTPKTARVAADRLVDVPAGYLALEPWSLHKAGGVGLAAIIEEARTNAYLDSYFAAADITAAWQSDGTLTRSTDVPAVYGTHVAKVVLTGGAGDSGATKTLLAQERPYSAGQNVTISGWVRGSASGLTVQRFIEALDSGGAVLGTVAADIVLGAWERDTLTYTGLPTGTAKTRSGIRAVAVDTGDTVTLYASAMQSEVGAFATSYIPTTTVAVTRGKEVVTVPTTGWNAATGTMVAVSRNLGTVQTRRIFAWENVAGGQALNLQCDGPVDARFIAQYADGTYLRAIRAPSANSAFVIAGRFVNGDTNVDCFVDGSKATSRDGTAASHTTLPTPSALAGIGNNANGDRPSLAVVARAIVYDTALTDEQLTAADMTTDLLAGLDTARITNEVTL